MLRSRFIYVLIVRVRTFDADGFDSFAQRRGSSEPNAAPVSTEARPAPIPPETASATDHEINLDGKPLRYTATAGTLLINGEDEQPYGSIFYVAYTLRGVTDARTRPVTFLYNGGPGSATLWLHMGSVGPMRVVTTSPEATGSAPYQMVTNQYTLLDRTDLVFIDAPGTGYSRPVGKGTVRDFAGTDQDAHAFARFIERYVTVNHRWNSPKFLFGESYGTTRSAVLVGRAGKRRHVIQRRDPDVVDPELLLARPGQRHGFHRQSAVAMRRSPGTSRRSRTRARTRRRFWTRSGPLPADRMPKRYRRATTCRPRKRTRSPPSWPVTPA